MMMVVIMMVMMMMMTMMMMTMMTMTMTIMMMMMMMMMMITVCFFMFCSSFFSPFSSLFAPEQHPSSPTPVAVYCLVAQRPSNTRVYLRDGSAQTILRAATLRYKLQIKLSTFKQYTDTGLTSPNADPVTPGSWQGSHWNTNL